MAFSVVVAFTTPGRVNTVPTLELGVLSSVVYQIDALPSSYSSSRSAPRCKPPLWARGRLSM